MNDRTPMRADERFTSLMKWNFRLQWPQVHTECTYIVVYIDIVAICLTLATLMYSRRDFLLTEVVMSGKVSPKKLWFSDGTVNSPPHFWWQQLQWSLAKVSHMLFSRGPYARSSNGYAYANTNSPLECSGRACQAMFVNEEQFWRKEWLWLRWDLESWLCASRNRKASSPLFFQLRLGLRSKTSNIHRSNPQFMQK